MVELKFHCCMPMFIARQWIRHRTANVNEYSGRYSLMPMLFYTPEPRRSCRPRARATTRAAAAAPSTAPFTPRRCGAGTTCAAEPPTRYEWMTGHEVARELARIDLPLSTYTQWYWKIDLHNLLHFLTLRVDAHAQWEIQEFGRVMAGMLKRVAPLSLRGLDRLRRLRRPRVAHGAGGAARAGGARRGGFDGQRRGVVTAPR